MAGKKKELGVYYTPAEMAELLSDWAIRDPEDRVLDSSFGGFVFLKAAAERLTELDVEGTDRREQIYGIDVDPVALKAARAEKALTGAHLAEGDFFSFEPDRDIPAVDVNIGNPPYVRYQEWGSEQADTIIEGLGLKVSKLSSLWVPFVLHGCRFLKPGGRMAQVLPAEALHAKYARSTTEYLQEHFSKLTVVLFQERVFPGVQEEIILLFAEGYGKGPAKGIGILEAKNLSALDLKKIDGRGQGYFDPDMALFNLLSGPARKLYKRLADDQQTSTLSTHGSVDIGVVTGANDFFITTNKEIGDRKLPEELFQPIISKAVDLRGAKLTRKDLHGLRNNGRPTELLVASDKKLVAEHASLKRMLGEGRKQGIDQRYKCRRRDPWWAVPIPAGGKADLFLTYMSDAYPRLATNQAKVLSTNTIHNVRLAKGVDPAALAVAFYNSLTLLSAELVGRSYGGGILKLEPSEAERLLFPPFPASLKTYLPQVDKLLREHDLDGILDLVDPLVLAPSGLDQKQIRQLRQAREKLVRRRRGRASR